MLANRKIGSLLMVTKWPFMPANSSATRIRCMRKTERNIIRIVISKVCIYTNTYTPHSLTPYLLYFLPSPTKR